MSNGDRKQQKIPRVCGTRFTDTHGTLTTAEIRYGVPPAGCAGGVAGVGCPPAGAGATGAGGAAGTGVGEGFGVAGNGVDDGCGAPGKVVSVPSVPGVKGPVDRVAFATSASAIDVVMKIVPRITVVRVSAFAVPRPVIKPPAPPPVPSPKPPPSDRCKRMTPIIAIHTTI